jgi:hypothetical protein
MQKEPQQIAMRTFERGASSAERRSGATHIHIATLREGRPHSSEGIAIWLRAGRPRCHYSIPGRGEGFFSSP